jgi:putative ABC transport system substrate-binding protein
MRRREFITLFSGAAAMPPLVARAQERVRHVTVVIGSGDDADDLNMKSRFAAFAHALQQLGWMDGSNVQINYRFASGKPENIRKHVDEIVAVAPDAVVIGGAAVVPSMLQATRTVPIVFTNVIDPIEPAILKAWRSRAAMPLVLSCWNTV